MALGKTNTIDRISERIRRLLQRPAREADREPEFGWGGTRIAAGLVLDDHVAELQGREAVCVATKMRRSDAQIRALTNLVSLPIRSTVWTLEPPEGAGAAEKEAAEMLQTNLMGGMEHSWDDLLREACLGVWFGFRVPEILWRDDGSLVSIRDVASRNLERLDRWCYDEAGALVGYVYTGNPPAGSGLSTTQTTGAYKEALVPIEKTVHFVYEGEGGNPTGFGLWRSCYQPWYIKSVLYKIMAIGVERNLLDVPVGRLHSSAKPSDRQKMRDILARWRAAEDAAVVLFEGQSIELIQSSRPLIDGMPFVQHLNQQILAAGLAQFVHLGQAEVGTQAVGQVQSRVWQMACQAHARWIAETVGMQLIRRWCLLNYGPKLGCPVLRWRSLLEKDLAGFANILSALTSAGALTPLPDDEEYLRGLLELPAIPKEQLASAREARAQQTAAAAGGVGGRDATASDSARGGRLLFAAGDEEREARRRTERAFQDEAAAVLEGIQRDYLARLEPLVKDAGDVSKIAQGKPIDKLPDVEVPGRSRYRDFVRAYLWRIFDAGRESLGTSGSTVSNRLRQWITAKAEMIADDHLAQLKTAILGTVLTGLRAEMPAERILQAAEAQGLNEWSRNTAAAWSGAAEELLSILGDGRATFADPAG